MVQYREYHAADIDHRACHRHSANEHLRRQHTPQRRGRLELGYLIHSPSWLPDLCHPGEFLSGVEVSH